MPLVLSFDPMLCTAQLHALTLITTISLAQWTITTNITPGSAGKMQQQFWTKVVLLLYDTIRFDENLHSNANREAVSLI